MAVQALCTRTQSSNCTPPDPADARRKGVLLAVMEVSLAVMTTVATLMILAEVPTKTDWPYVHFSIAVEGWLVGLGLDDACVTPK